MLRNPCSACGTRSGGKLASLYWAWFRVDGERTAWKQRLCVECTRTSLVTLLEHSTQDSSILTMCPACGADASSDLDPIYLTLYLPKADPLSYELPTCAPCAARIRIAAQVGAQKLADRQQRSSSSSDVSAWGELGLSPQA